MWRIGLAALLGGAIMFGWGFVSWMYIPWHVMQTMPAENQIVQSMGTAGLTTGVYYYPNTPRASDDLAPEAMAAQLETAQDKHREGPIMTVAYRAEGAEMMGVMTMVTGFIINLVTALVAAIMLNMAAGSIGGYMGRLMFVTLLGVYAAFAVNLMDWNWAYAPMRFTLELAVDGVVGALLMGLVVAALVKPGS